MEQPQKDPSASDRQEEETATPIADPTDMQMYRWKDDGGAVVPEPQPELDTEPEPEQKDKA